MADVPDGRYRTDDGSGHVFPAHCRTERARRTVLDKPLREGRLLEVLDTRLPQWLAADQYTIADISIYPWARAYIWAKVSVDDLDNLNAWFARTSTPAPWCKRR